MLNYLVEKLQSFCSFTNPPPFRGTALNGTLTGVEWQSYRKERTAMNFETSQNALLIIFQHRASYPKSGTSSPTRLSLSVTFLPPIFQFNLELMIENEIIEILHK